MAEGLPAATYFNLDCYFTQTLNRALRIVYTILSRIQNFIRSPLCCPHPGSMSRQATIKPKAAYNSRRSQTIPAISHCWPRPPVGMYSQLLAWCPRTCSPGTCLRSRRRGLRQAASTCSGTDVQRQKCFIKDLRPDGEAIGGRAGDESRKQSEDAETTEGWGPLEDGDGPGTSQGAG